MSNVKSMLWSFRVFWEEIMITRYWIYWIPWICITYFPCVTNSVPRGTESNSLRWLRPYIGLHENPINTGITSATKTPVSAVPLFSRRALGLSALSLPIQSSVWEIQHVSSLETTFVQLFSAVFDQWNCSYSNGKMWMKSCIDFAMTFWYSATPASKETRAGL